MYSSEFNVFCVTETWLSDYIYDCEILPSDFVLYRKDRPSRGGGVLVAVSKSIYSSHISSPSNLEIVSVMLGQDLEFILCSVYVPPNSSEAYLSSLLSYLTHLVTSYKRCIFVGDFNFPDIDWFSLTGCCPLSNSFCEFIFDSNLTQHVMEPTHVKGNILDLILTSAIIDITHLSIQPSSHFYSCDHFILSFIPQCDISVPDRPKSGYVFDYSRADFDSICSYLMDSDFSCCLQCNDIEFIWSIIKYHIFMAMSLFIPKIYLKHRHGPKWFNSDIRHHIKCLRSMRKKYKATPTLQRKNNIKLSEEQLQQKMSQAKSSFEHNLIQSIQPSNPSKIYSYLRTITGGNTIPLCVNLGSTSAVSDYDKASLFNQYFHSVFTNSDFILPAISNLPTPSSVIDEISITESDVYKALASLDPSKAMGYDGISPRLLKHCALPLCQPLLHLFFL